MPRLVAPSSPLFSTHPTLPPPTLQDELAVKQYAADGSGYLWVRPRNNIVERRRSEAVSAARQQQLRWNVEQNLEAHNQVTVPKGGGAFAQRRKVGPYLTSRCPRVTPRLPTDT